MSEDAILRLQQTGLFKKLLEKEDEETKRTSLIDHEISKNITSVVDKVSSLLERIPINMPEFTLHNANHSIHVIKNIEDLIPPETLEQLNAIEISILIYAAYLHDIGMISSSDERKQIVKTSEFKKLLTSDEELYEKFEKAKKDGDYEAVLDIENKAFTDFLRKNHVERAHKIIKEYELDFEILWKGTSYYKWVKAVCDSHGLPVKELKKNDNWPIDVLVRNKPVNVQYLSLVLRLADILDLDSERTPKHLFYHINPKDEISIQEWEKHLSITGFQIKPEEIKVEAECESPNCERVLREFIKTIDKELEESNYLISSYRDDFARKYRLNLSEPVNLRIHPNDYEYRDFRFELDYRRVLDLLMGEGLYGDPVVALRELLQNSVDAVRYRESLEKRDGNGYRPSIEVSLENNELIVEDNGIGMDEEIFKNYFMKVGRSYYQSSDFREKNVDIDPVSEFGIGILSVFMVADKFTVESRRKTFEDEFNLSEPIYFEIPTAYDYFVKRQSTRSKYGTKITLYLKSNHPFSAETLMQKISEIAPFIEYQIKINTDKGNSEYKPLLPGERVKKEKIVKEYFEILFDNKKEGMEGKISVIITLNRYRANPELTIFTQKGFAIPCQELLPKWLSNNIQASINLSGKSKLSLSPSRSYVIKDEKYYKFIGEMQTYILEGLEEYLKTSRVSSPIKEYIENVNELFEYNILTLYPRQTFSHQGFVYEEEILKNIMAEIFFEHVPLLTISGNGQKEYKTMKELDMKASLAIIGVTDLPDKVSDAKILEETNRLIGAKTILSMQEDVKQQRNFLEKILGRSSDIYITSIPGVVIETFLNNQFLENSSSVLYKGNLRQIHNFSGEKMPIFVHLPGLYEGDDTKVVYNAYHPLFARLLNGENPKDEASSEAQNILIIYLAECLSHVYSTLNSSSFRQNDKLQKSSNINHMLIGILKYYPEIFQEFYETVEQYWEEAKDLGVISRDEDFIGFSLDDLPWFWNCELSDFKFE